MAQDGLSREIALCGLSGRLCSHPGTPWGAGGGLGRHQRLWASRFNFEGRPRQLPPCGAHRRTLQCRFLDAVGCWAALGLRRPACSRSAKVRACPPPQAALAAAHAGCCIARAPRFDRYSLDRDCRRAAGPRASGARAAGEAHARRAGKWIQGGRPSIQPPSWGGPGAVPMRWGAGKLGSQSSDARPVRPRARRLPLGEAGA